MSKKASTACRRWLETKRSLARPDGRSQPHTVEGVPLVFGGHG